VYRWQIPMVASLAHRASGIVLALFVPIYLFLLTGLTSSPEDFTSTLDWMHSLPGSLILWLTGMALIYHLVNGIRFILLDAGWFEGRDAMRITARVSIGAGVLGGLLLGGFLW
jgi:succinate dehydrogenase / fumarate reductase cytochrome b subunit